MTNKIIFDCDNGKRLEFSSYEELYERLNKLEEMEQLSEVGVKHMKHKYKNEVVELIGVYQWSNVIDPSPFVGGHPGGVVAYPIAVIKTKNGDIKNVHPYQLKGCEEE